MITIPLGCQLPAKTNKPRSCTVTSQSVSNLFALSSRPRMINHFLAPDSTNFPEPTESPNAFSLSPFPKPPQLRLEQRAKTDPKIDQFFAISLLFVVIGRSAGMFRGFVCTSGNYYVRVGLRKYSRLWLTVRRWFLAPCLGESTTLDGEFFFCRFDIYGYDNRCRRVQTRARARPDG